MPTNDVIAQAEFRLSWASGTLRFSQYFLTNTAEDQKKSYLSEGPLALSHIR